jgi:SAM-dependent methyltransferase
MNQKNKQLLEKIVQNITHGNLNRGREVIEKFICELSYEKVLDLGAGEGADLKIALRKNPQAKAYAIENYPPFLEKLRNKKIESFNLNLENSVLPFQDEEIDLIIINQVLEHTKEIFWIFHEMSRTLRKNGHIIIGVPNLASLHNRILLLFGEQPSCIFLDSAHLRGFTKGDLERFAGIGNLKLKRVTGSNFYPFPPLIANFLSKIFPSLSVGIFLIFQKNKKYNQEYLNFPTNNKLETNFFVGK